MPFLKSITVFPDTVVGLWALDEPAEVLMQMLSELTPKFIIPDQIKLDKRKREFAARSLLMHAMGQTLELAFLPNGKPVISEGYLSFSHSSALVAFAQSARPVGVDVQWPDPKLSRISTKFCHPDEGGPQSDLIRLTTLWTVKEAVFKIFGQGVNFKDVRLTATDRAKWQTADISVDLDIATIALNDQILTVAAPVSNPTLNMHS